jgi:hypothetical protein
MCIFRGSQESSSGSTGFDLLPQPRFPMQSHILSTGEYALRNLYGHADHAERAAQL